METKSGSSEMKGKDPDYFDTRMRISTITALARVIHERSIARRKFNHNNNGKTWKLTRTTPLFYYTTLIRNDPKISQSSIN